MLACIDQSTSVKSATHFWSAMALRSPLSHEVDIQ